MESDPTSDQTGPEELTIVITELDDLLSTADLGALGARSMDDLRGLRDRLGEIELGLSFGRRMAQGRLDIVLAEFHNRLQGRTESTHELLGRLPEVLSSQGRGQGMPRPVRDAEIPPFADEILAELDRLVHPTDLAVIEDFDVDALDAAAQRVSAYERALSHKRTEVHRLIDEVQEEIITRYRTGSVSVDDLLKG